MVTRCNYYFSAGVRRRLKKFFFNFTYNHGLKWYAGKNIHLPKITLAIIVAAQAVIIFFYFFFILFKHFVAYFKHART